MSIRVINGVALFDVLASMVRPTRLAKLDV